MLVTSLGQLDDLFDATGQPVSEDHIRRKYIQKTSYYTFINPLQMGAALAGASNADLQPLRAYGEQAGLVYQISDDQIGMYGDPKESGKSATDDLREGKVTLLMHTAFERATPEQTAVLRAAWGNHDVTAEQHQAVLTVLDKTGASTYAREQAETAAAAAREALKTMGGSEGGRSFLAGLLRYVMERKQ
jgi:geranylgeranyl diphosphate synthase type I